MTPTGDTVGFDYDFATLCDMVERRNAGESPDARWRILVRLDSGTGTHSIRAVKGQGEATMGEPVQGTDFDGAASRLAPRLARRGVIPTLTAAA